jgi:predicted RNA-binding Zn ribbon-like protein
MPRTPLEVERAKRVGGRLCLDFVNTVQSRMSTAGARPGRDDADGVVGERLVSYAALLRWGVLSGAVTERDARALAREASATPSKAAIVLKRSLACREAMYRIFKAAIEEWNQNADDVASLNRELRTARAREQLVASPHFEWQWELDASGLDRILWPIVGSAADLLTTGDLKRVRQCPGEACGWLFLDTSRSGRRQWCDMADCGNLAKVRRFRERHRPSEE